MLEINDERYIPWMEVGEIHYEHLHRYSFASLFSQGMKVLDLACGEGYGTNILSLAAKYAVGIDINERCINHAKNKYIRDNIEFKVGSIASIPIEGKEIFDTIVCFEALEHVEEQEKCLSEVKRLLKKDGFLIISTPNKTNYSDKRNFINPFHVKELYFEEFKDLLSPFFKNVSFLGQRLFIVSNIWPLSKTDDMGYNEFVIDKKNNEYAPSDISSKIPIFYIAVASNVPIKNRTEINSYLVDSNNLLYEKKDTLITEYFNGLKEKEAELKVSYDLIMERDESLRQRDELLRQRDELLRQRDELLRQRDEQIKSQQEFINAVKNSVAYKLYKKTIKPLRHSYRKIIG